jgi:dihydrofolate reductase
MSGCNPKETNQEFNRAAARGCGIDKGEDMRRLIVFNNVTVDGYFAAANGEMQWAHRNAQDEEYNAFVAGNANGDGQLLFGRITYQMMASFWPTPMAMEQLPAIAKGMNGMPKVVFSRTLKEATWNNTKLVKGDVVEEVRKMKKEVGPDLAILGSGSIVAQLANVGLIDEYQVMVNPVILGGGRTMFDGMTKKLNLKLAKTRAFRNGNVLLNYESAA